MSAVDWIKIRTNLASDPAVAFIGSRTKLHPRHVTGNLVAIWSWADALTSDGLLRLAMPATIDEIAGKRGFADAMQAVGWLEILPEGLRFPRWERHNGQSAKARAGEAERKRQQRASGPSTPENKPGVRTETVQQSGQLSGQKADGCPDQRREEKKSNPPAPRKRGDGEGPEGDKHFPTTEEAKAVAAIFNRRPTTAWSEKEYRAFKKARPTMEDIALVAAYCAAEKAKGDDGIHRRDLLTLLNNWPGEIDRAQAYAESQGPTSSGTKTAPGEFDWAKFRVWAATAYPSLDTNSGPGVIPPELKQEFLNLNH